MKTATVRAGTHIEGIHWIAEYVEDVHEIRVYREGQEVDIHNAPSTLFGDEENAGSKVARITARRKRRCWLICGASSPNTTAKSSSRENAG